MWMGHGTSKSDWKQIEYAFVKSASQLLDHLYMYYMGEDKLNSILLYLSKEMKSSATTTRARKMEKMKSTICFSNNRD
ncbi:hypothetical protein P8452_43017 [Trifolium repens]|nr:hypothetical protein P8452_43017 [Trifolium repens]